MIPGTYIINYNHSNNLYEIREGSSNYSMELKLTQMLKQYLKTHKKGTITEWYNKLDDTMKGKIIVTQV